MLRVLHDMIRIRTSAPLAHSVVENGIVTHATVGTYAGLRAVFVRHYAGNMIEIRVPGGLIVVDRQHFICWFDRGFGTDFCRIAPTL